MVKTPSSEEPTWSERLSKESAHSHCASKLDIGFPANSSLLCRVLKAAHVLSLRSISSKQMARLILDSIDEKLYVILKRH